MIAFKRLVIDRVVTRDDVQHSDIEAATAHLCRRLNEIADTLRPGFPGIDDPMALAAWLKENSVAVNEAEEITRELIAKPLVAIEEVQD